jgi:hypothetical protein
MRYKFVDIISVCHSLFICILQIRELEMSTTAQAADGGKQRLELLLLQREVEQQQQQNHYIRKSLNRMPEAPARVVHHPEYWQTLKSTRPTWGSIKSDISCQEPGRGFSNASNLANGMGHVACNEQVQEGDPLPKRQRKMMQIRHAHFQTSSATLVLA